MWLEKYRWILLKTYVSHMSWFLQLEENIWDESGEEVRVKKENRKEITTHVAIHTIHLDGLRELYRHFLRLPDGAIVEVGSFTSTLPDLITSSISGYSGAK